MQYMYILVPRTEETEPWMSITLLRTKDQEVELRTRNLLIVEKGTVT